jgi:hypothetical protein
MNFPNLLLSSMTSKIRLDAILNDLTLSCVQQTVQIVARFAITI